MTVHEWLRWRLLQRAGLAPRPDLDQIRREQWCPDFVRKMSNRMVVGWFRYGPIRDPAAKPYDNIGSAIERLRDYLSDGNLEHLVDVANLCLIEYVKGPRGIGSHPRPHWQPKDDGAHTRLVSNPDETCDECQGRASWQGEVGFVQCWKCYGTGKSRPTREELQRAKDRMQRVCEGGT